MYTQITKKNAAKFEIGTRVRFFYGPMHGEDFGTITGIRENTIPYSGSTVALTAITDDGRHTSISGFTTVGIGAYLI